MIGAGENYCAALGIQILRGRDFEIADRGRKPIPVIVNRTLAQEFFAGGDPIGQYLIMGREQEDRLQIVGVAANSKMRTLGEGDVPGLFRPEFNAQLLVRVTGSPGNWIEPLRGALGEVDRTAALDIRPLAEATAGALFPLRMATGFVGSFSVLGVALALIGLYGSVSYAVRRRTREFGIRAALGASRSRIVWTAVRDGLMNAEADLFLQIPGIVKTLPDPIDQMKLFELIQIMQDELNDLSGANRPIEVKLFGPKYDQLRELAKEVSEVHFYTFDPGDMRTEMHQAAFPGEDISDRPEPETVVPAIRSLLDSGAPSGRYSASEFAS